jgi:hypothetical protein
MNQIHPIFDDIIASFAPAEAPAVRGTSSDARRDLTVLRQMETILRDKLTDAVAACYAEARDLKALDADAVMGMVNKYFAPTGPFQQENFTEAFHGFNGACDDAAPNYKER